MPSLPAADRVAKVEVLGELGGVNCVNVLHFRKGSTINAGDMATLATAAKTGWQSNMLGVQTDNYVLKGIQATDLTSLSGEQVFSPSGQVGQVAGALLPNSAAMCVTVKSATRSRSGRGRVFLGGLSQAGLENSVSWSAQTMTDVLTQFTDFLTACQNAGGAATWVFGILSYYSGVDEETKKPILRPTPVFFPNTSISVDSRVDTQRRRLGKTA